MQRAAGEHWFRCVRLSRVFTLSRPGQRTAKSFSRRRRGYQNTMGRWRWGWYGHEAIILGRAHSARVQTNWSKFKSYVLSVHERSSRLGALHQRPQSFRRTQAVRLGMFRVKYAAEKYAPVRRAPVRAKANQHTSRTGPERATSEPGGAGQTICDFMCKPRALMAAVSGVPRRYAWAERNPNTPLGWIAHGLLCELLYINIESKAVGTRRTAFSRECGPA